MDKKDKDIANIIVLSILAMVSLFSLYANTASDCGIYVDVLVLQCKWVAAFANILTGAASAMAWLFLSEPADKS